MWNYGAIVVVLLLLLVLVFVAASPAPPKPPSPIQCATNNEILKPVWRNDEWVCPKDSTPINTCSSDDECQQGYRCDEVCKINCTNSEGNIDDLAVTNCSNGYYSEPWISASYYEGNALSLPHVSGDSVLQIKNPYYGNKQKNCESAGSSRLVDDNAAGKDLRINAYGYNSYFGGDPCYGALKTTSFDYRYVPMM